jgi:hypothetical protein
MGCDIPIHVGNKMIFSECEGDFEKFAKKFFVKFGKLQVTGFHHAQRLLRESARTMARLRRIVRIRTRLRKNQTRTVNLQKWSRLIGN